MRKWLNMLMKIKFLRSFIRNGKDFTKKLFEAKHLNFTSREAVKEIFIDFVHCSYSEKEDQGKISNSLSFYLGKNS